MATLTELFICLACIIKSAFTENTTTNTSITQQRTNSNETESGNWTIDNPETTFHVDYVGYVIVPLFFVLGICGNSMTITVMLGKKFRRMTSSWILIALSVSDTIFCCVAPFNKKFIRTMLGYDVRAMSSIGCSLFFIFHKSSKMSSSWFTVFICFERFIAVCFPLKTKRICSKRNALIGIAVVYIFMFTYNGVWDFSVLIIDGICVPNHATPENANTARIFLLFGTSMYSFVPVFIMLILTPAICVQLMRQSKLRRTISNSCEGKDGDVAKITAMLLAVTIAFILLVAPVAIAHNVSFALQVKFFESTRTDMIIVREVLQVMEQLNYSINFILYVLCCRAFRQRVSRILGCRCISPTTMQRQASASNDTNISTVM